MLADTLPCFLKAHRTQLFLFDFLEESIKRMRDLKNLRELSLVCSYLTQLFSMISNPEESFELIKKIVKFCKRLDCYIAYPIDKISPD